MTEITQERKQFIDVVSSEIKSKTLRYQIKTYDFMQDTLNRIIPLAEPFKSQFKK